MMDTKQFVVGIGSQRAGSTLLHKILESSSDVFMHPVKELHYFDTLSSIRDPQILKDYSKNNILRICRNIYENKHLNIDNKKFRCELRTNNILFEKEINDIDYIDLFRPCLLGNEQIGEITPEYMLLTEESIKNMASVIGNNAIIILITRDPIERFLSSVKLLNVYGKKEVKKIDINKEVEKCISGMPSWVEQQIQLSNYEHALFKFRKYFNNVVCLNYELLVKDPMAELYKLTDHINGLDIKQAEKILGTRINSLGESTASSSKTINTIKLEYNKYNVDSEVRQYE